MIRITDKRDKAIHTMNDEFVHHRGQLYAYARACGGNPPFVWGHADNEPDFAPSH